ARFAYNWALQKEREAYAAGEKFIGNNDLRKAFTVLRNSDQYSWLKTISNNVTKQAIKDCVDAYTKFFKKKSRRPRYRSKKRGDYSFYQDTSKIQITSTQVKLEAIATSKRRNRQSLNWIRLSERDRIPVGVKYFQPRITFDGLNWWLSVAVEFEPEKISTSSGDALGIDLGIKNLAVCSDGTVYPNINKTKKVKKLKQRKRRLQRSISRKYEMSKKKGEGYSKTRNIIKGERKLLEIHHRLANIRQNYRHQITRAIIGRNPSSIVLEDLNVRGMMSNRHLSKAVQEQGFYEFRRQIEYKAEWFGITVIIADRFYASSKTCISCGHVKKNLRLSERIYHCEKCGNEIDRDLQAAINLKRYAS
ncbi:MAG: transposase, partial [Selenomonadaceae bacterium]|nr:transposase [Selenomonadaceae bacterium]